jgi:hypothetical protein
MSQMLISFPVALFFAVSKTIHLSCSGRQLRPPAFVPKESLDGYHHPANTSVGACSHFIASGAISSRDPPQCPCVLSQSLAGQQVASVETPLILWLSNVIQVVATMCMNLRNFTQYCRRARPRREYARGVDRSFHEAALAPRPSTVNHSLCSHLDLRLSCACLIFLWSWSSRQDSAAYSHSCGRSPGLQIIGRLHQTAHHICLSRARRYTCQESYCIFFNKDLKAC